jgi:hypothetical protein
LATVAAVSIGVGVSNATTTTNYTLPPVNAKFDYQIGIGATYTPPAGVKVVSRDRLAAPAAGLYNICYVNTFQTQPAEIPWWKANHDDLLLKDAKGEYVTDEGWGEILLDVSTPAKRKALATIVNGWIDGCAANGFKAVEPDNIDSYDRSKGRLTKANAIAFLKLLAPHAHRRGLALAQKNATELGTAGKELGLDFAVAEECGQYGDCDYYTSVYGRHVIGIEYIRDGFTKACKAKGSSISIVLRDVKVTAPGSSTYQYDAC